MKHALRNTRRTRHWFAPTLICALFSACSDDPAGTGSGAIQCLDPLADCDGKCVDTVNDPANCGGCAISCSDDEVCSVSSCSLVCLGGTDKCGELCVDLQSASKHCGQCDSSCDAGQVCSDGACLTQCAGGTEKCGDKCVDTQLDAAHCGKCDSKCSGGEVCSMGSCGLSCVGGTEKCGDKCVDTQIDPAHCSKCDVACGAGQACLSALCCDSNEANCSGQCVDLQSDVGHCGACANGCMANQVCSAGTCALAPSCRALLDGDPNLPDGIYSIDPDGAGQAAPFGVYCDMTTDLGGWTLVARFSNADADNWMLDSGEWWYSRLTQAGKTTSRSEDLDMLSLAFWTVKADELKLSRTDGSDAHLLMTKDKCLGGNTFRALITSFGDFSNAAIWGADSVQGSCSVDLAGNYAATAGFSQADCVTGDIGGAAKLSFWADWDQGDGAVMMIGGGGGSCGRADHGIGVTEANSASFYFVDPAGEGDFGDDGYDTPAGGYALNLFVR